MTFLRAFTNFCCVAGTFLPPYPSTIITITVTPTELPLTTTTAPNAVQGGATNNPNKQTTGLSVGWGNLGATISAVIILLVILIFVVKHYRRHRGAARQQRTTPATSESTAWLAELDGEPLGGVELGGIEMVEMGTGGEDVVEAEGNPLYELEGASSPQELESPMGRYELA